MRVSLFVWLKVATAVFTFLFCMSFFASAHANDYSWNKQTVSLYDARAGTQDDANHVCLALDKQNNPHIVYHEANGDANFSADILKYASLSNNSWNIQNVSPDNIFVSSGCSLAFDSKNTPHIIYFGASLEYATLTGTTWDIVSVDPNLGANSTIYFTDCSCSLALDSNDNPQIAYTVYNTLRPGYSLEFAVKNSLGWTIQTVDQNAGKFCSLALDKQGNPMISYNVQKNIFGVSASLKFAKWVGSTWDIKTVDPTESSYCSLALDSNDKPSICYSAYTNESSQNSLQYGTLRYASLDGLTWQIQDVYKAGWANGINSIVMDSNNKPIICFDYVYVVHNGMNIPGAYLKMASLSGSEWSVQDIDTNASSGACSMALDSANNLHLSYFDSSLYLIYSDTVSVSTPSPSILPSAPSPTESFVSEPSPSPSVPEFSTWIILPLAMVTLTLATVVAKRKRSK